MSSRRSMKYPQLLYIGRRGAYVVVLLLVSGTVYTVVHSVTANLYLAWWTVLVLVVWGALFSQDVDFFIRWALRRTRVSQNVDAKPITPTRRFQTATIAFDLVPCLEDFLSDSSTSDSCTLVITGNDCYTLTLEDVYPWKKFLTEILERNRCRVVQYVSHGKHPANNILQALQDKYPDRFEYRQLLNPELASDPEDRALLTALYTYHPTLAWKGRGEKHDDKMMWVETYHPPASTEAFSCDYYDTQALMRNSDAFDFFRERLDAVWAMTQRHTSLR